MRTRGITKGDRATGWIGRAAYARRCTGVRVIKRGCLGFTGLMARRQKPEIDLSHTQCLRNVLLMTVIPLQSLEWAFY
jgi:hypothetical protein